MPNAADGADHHDGGDRYGALSVDVRLSPMACPGVTASTSVQPRADSAARRSQPRTIDLCQGGDVAHIWQLPCAVRTTTVCSPADHLIRSREPGRLWKTGALVVAAGVRRAPDLGPRWRSSPRRLTAFEPTGSQRARHRRPSAPGRMASSSAAAALGPAMLLQQSPRQRDVRGAGTPMEDAPLAVNFDLSPVPVDGRHPATGDAPQEASTG